MFRILRERWVQKSRTNGYPEIVPPLPDRFRGRPAVDGSKCPTGCQVCQETCPTNAIALADTPSIDLGKCLFCGECAAACPEQAIDFTGEFRLAVREREALTVSSGSEYQLAQKLDERLRKLLGRSLRLRVVSSGGCNGCEVDTNVLSTIVWDVGRFGIQYVASPRHADGLLVCGPVTNNMKEALQQTYEAVPDPKIVIAVGACAISGGPYFESTEQAGGAAGVVPVDLYIPGCPPHPLTILDGLLRLVGRMEEKASA